MNLIPEYGSVACKIPISYFSRFFKVDLRIIAHFSPVSPIPFFELLKFGGGVAKMKKKPFLYTATHEQVTTDQECPLPQTKRLTEPYVYTRVK